MPTTKYCTACETNTKTIDAQYIDFMEGTDSISGQKCKEIYNEDLHVIDFMYKYSKELWKELKCAECFLHPNETKDFLEEYKEFQHCVHTNKNDTCKKCDKIYQNITTAYDYIKEENPRQICGEIMEDMHHVKKIWSKDFSCNKKQKSGLTLFTVVSSILMLLQGLFYGGLKYTFRNHPKDQTAAIEYGNKNNQASNEPETSTINSNNEKQCSEKIDAISDISTDTEEEVILELNPNKQQLLNLAQDLPTPQKVEFNSTLSMKNDSTDDEMLLSVKSCAGPKDTLLL